jgi:hypothetical protein
MVIHRPATGIMTRITLEEAQKNPMKYFAMVSDGTETVTITDLEGNSVTLVPAEKDSDEISAVRDFMDRKDDAYRRLAR